MENLEQEGLNKESQSTEAGQSETDESQEEIVVEDVSSLPEWAQNKLNKAEQDKENYKKGMLKYKNRTLETETQTEEENEAYPEWDETSKQFQKQTLSQAERIAEQQATKIFQKTNEKTAIRKFLTKHPELEAEEVWSEVVANYTPKNGKDTQEDILADLDRALFLTRYEKGEVSSMEELAFKKGQQEGMAKAKLTEAATVSKTTGKQLDKGKILSDGARSLAQKMRVDEKKLAEEDDSLTATISI